MSFLVCGIRDKRPKVCEDYPKPGNYIPDCCGHYFTDEGKKGSCYLECQASCCMLPRQGGEPGGAPLPEIAGGIPCKHLDTVDEAPEGAVVERPEE